MALFGRRRRHEEDVDEYDDRYDEQDEGGGDDLEPEFEGDLFEYAGPHDEADAPDDGLNRLDLGSVRLPVPDGAQLQVEMDQNRAVRAVHVVTPVGQLTVNAYAAPKSGGLWREVCGELAEQLRGDGAKVRSSAGEWGQELVAALGEVSLRFIGVDGPRWMLRGVVAGPPDLADQSTHALYDLVRGTVVVRGTQPMPVRTPLPIELPPSIAQHIEAQQS
ncbi:DUF3710 domain-containing protein [Actinophytocola algeriensis]|uniref:DUF3710 domain-containing protein n=1 Tax=Actinophytocola algeriensis TaxID=1768010 RepID=A0A7W7Q0X1_9PSEU|nr:DUF3710 domain-containing protein [Actinophytocola algeriensis]MBB4904929.1 hypothetical protein [Actinophytocola algeriensis]MBE1476211.1 hypothetical protein [Actinophytocola algeriensis]